MEEGTDKMGGRPWRPQRQQKPIFLSEPLGKSETDRGDGHLISRAPSIRPLGDTNPSFAFVPFSPFAAQSQTQYRWFTRLACW
jgi:hypothetical protein